MNKLIKYIIESRFNFNIDLLDIEDNEENFSLSKQLYKSKSMKEEYLEDNLFVDLGLPSGTKWCRYNIGCDFGLLLSNPESTSPKDWYGNYYAWGEIKGKNEYTWTSYEYAKYRHDQLTKYCSKSNYGYKNFTDNLVELLPEDDAAYQYNSSWKIPTYLLCQELIDYTDGRWISGENNNLYMNIEGLRGRLSISKINGNQIFIPAAGYMDEQSSLNYGGSDCFLWSSSLNSDRPNDVWYLYLYSGYILMCDGNRCYGLNVRAVLTK